MKVITICLLLHLFPNWLEKKMDAFIKEKIKTYSKYIKIEKIKYIFPNKLSLSGIFYNKEGFSFKGDGLLEIRVGQVPKLYLFQPVFSLKKAFFKKKRRISLPNIEIIVENGRGEIADFGLFDNVCGGFKNKRFSFKGYGLGGLASIEGTEFAFKAYIKEAKLSLVPYLPAIKKEGKADITIKKEKGIEIIAKIKDASIKDAKKIKGELELKEKISSGRLSFLWNNIPIKIEFKEKRGFYGISGNFYYKKTNFAFSLEGQLRDNVFRIIKGDIENIRFWGEMGKEVTLFTSFENKEGVLFHPSLKGFRLSGTGTITGSLEKPSLAGSFTIAKDNEVIALSISGDRNLLFFNIGTISTYGIKLTEGANGTISLKPISISCNLIDPIFFKDGKITGSDNGFDLCLLSERRRLFLKTEKEKVIRFKYADFIKGISLDCTGWIIFEKDVAKLRIDQGRIGEIPINQALCNIRLKEGILIENLELLLDGITSLNASGKIEKNQIDAPILITNLKVDRFLKNLKAKADFKGRIIGEIEKPAIFGQIYSPEPKLMADVAIIDHTLTLKNGRLYNTMFEFDLFLFNKSISGFAGFEKEELLRISNLFLIPPYISGIAEGSATFSGSLENPEIKGSITVSNPLFFGALAADSLGLMFMVKDRVFSSTSYITSFPGFISLNTNILPSGGIESKGNISNFKLAELPITGSFSFNGLYNEGAMEGSLSTSNIIASGYRIPDIIEEISYYPECGLKVSGLLSGVINKGFCDIILKLDRFPIGSSIIKGSITLKGETNDPEINGEIDISGSDLKLPIFAEPLLDVSCKIRINEGMIRVLSFKGETKKTQIALSQIKDNTFEIKTSGEAIKIEIPGIIKGEASGELIVENIEGELKSKGKITISNARFTYPPTKQTSAPSFLGQFIYGPRIEVGQNVWFYNEFCEANVNKGGWIRLQRVGNKTKLEGSCHSRRGRIEYLGSNFTLAQADFEFRDGIPYLEGNGEATIEGIPLRLSYSGMVSLPLILSLSSPSFPEKTQDELVSLLKKEKGAGLIAGFVGERITKEITRSLRSFLRLDLEVITPFPERLFQGTETYSYALIGTEVKVGRYLTEKFYLIYEGTIEDYEEERYKYKHKIGFEYDLGRRTGIRYLYTPKEKKRKEDFEIGIKKLVDF